MSTEENAVAVTTSDRGMTIKNLSESTRATLAPSAPESSNTSAYLDACPEGELRSITIEGVGTKVRDRRVALVVTEEILTALCAAPVRTLTLRDVALAIGRAVDQPSDP